MSVAALQKTKWFGNEIYKIGSSVVLTAGRDVRGVGQVRQRGEGVAIVLCGKAWKAGCNKWKAWVITATLEVSGGRLLILSCYSGGSRIL